MLTDGPADRMADRQTNGHTKHLIELRSTTRREKKKKLPVRHFNFLDFLRAISSLGVLMNSALLKISVHRNVPSNIAVRHNICSKTYIDSNILWNVTHLSNPSHRDLSYLSLISKQEKKSLRAICRQ